MKHCLPKGVGALRHRWQRVHRGRRARRLPQRICLLCPSWPGGGLSVLFVKFSYFSVLFLYFAYLSVCLRFLSIHPPMDLLYVSSVYPDSFSLLQCEGENWRWKKMEVEMTKEDYCIKTSLFVIFILTEELEKLSSGARRISWGITRTERVFSRGEKQSFLGNKFLVFGASMILVCHALWWSVV